jgi:hypothetical protein
LTSSYGHPKLREQLAGITMIAKYSPTLEVFAKRLDQDYPEYGTMMPLPVPEKPKEPVHKANPT